MKKTFTLALAMVIFSATASAQTTISAARGMALGTVVTVKGLVTNGAELGTIRYLQDHTAGISAYGSNVTPINKGDSITITGTLKNYNGLLELDPVSSFTVLSTGNPDPAPIVLTPAQIGEAYESRLVKILNATFIDGGSIFSGNKNYQITANGAVGWVRIGQNDPIGTLIPTGLVNITALLSQYTLTGSGGYQLLPRTIADIQIISPIHITTPLFNPIFTQSSLDFNWTTNIAGTTEMFYGNTLETVRTNKVGGVGGSTSHDISISGLLAGQIAWVQAFSVTGGDTAFSAITPFATISNSSGNIKVYFNTQVNTSYSSGVNAIYLNQTIDDTLIRYINRAKHTIDLAIYSFNNSGISNISAALNAAASRGVIVRAIGCGTTTTLGLNELSGANMYKLVSPNSSNRTGLMHNKFILIDTDSNDPNDPLVWTGSTNWTTGNINTDANNVIIVQDQSLARGFKIEFEEMWGSSANTPNAAKALYGSKKRNNTPREFVINGKRVECYFSPSDGTNSKLIQTIETANHNLNIATNLITRTDIASAIVARRNAGCNVHVLTNAAGGNSASVNTTLLASLGSTNYIYDAIVPGTMHNKYMIVDQGAIASDPTVFTGSHNWSLAADNNNDENTLIIHDATIANIYYQNFVYLFLTNNGVITSIDEIDFSSIHNKNQLTVFPNPIVNGKATILYQNPSNELGTLQLIDVSGSVVFNQTINLARGETAMAYNFPGALKGFFIIKLTTGSSVLTNKVLFK